MNYSYKVVLFFFLAITSSKLLGQFVQRRTTIPNVIGLTLKQAKIVLQKNKINLGAIIYNSKSMNLDTLRVYKQNLTATNGKWNENHLKQKNAIDIWLVNSYNSLDTLKKTKNRSVTRQISNK